MADLDHGEIELDLSLARLRRQIAADDVRQNLARTVQKRLLFRASVLHVLQGGHRPRQFSHLRIGLDDRKRRANGLLTLESSRACKARVP